MFNAAHSARTTTFGRGAKIIRARGNEPLTLDEIAVATPSVFAIEKHSSRSERYTYIPTSDVVRGLQKEGFQPFEVRQGGSKIADKKDFTKHMIRFRHAGVRALPDSHREVILVNSHDGTSSYQMFDGVFRIVCCNGLIMADDNGMDAIKIPHKGDIVGKVIDAAYTVIEKGQHVGGLIEHIRSIDLRPAEQEAFAEAARELRFEEGAADQLAPALINQARRRDDVGNDLWKTFNRVQENLVKGGVTYNHTNANNMVSRRSIRPVNSIDGNVSLNRALWTLTARMAEIKAAA
ncbi:DUF932 domain-containing protein [Bradyrhizobium sp. Ai1a-2]|uniref:DUF932 domain-containing protein n=1 Tax=Bradyrhizobium sp. Ai1a-2 TaxID=196490 RepID=UPI0003F5504E|nr:DUF932 domain-containing protein [Bradyrhizobium sp. Ai1a-2]